MSRPSRTTVEIVGIGMHPFGRFEGLTATDMGVAAVREALADAGSNAREVQAAFCGTAYGGVAAGHRVLGALAATGIPIIDVEAGCASGGAALQLGAAAIESGRCDQVLVFGIEKMPKGVIRSSFFAPWQEAAGLTPAPAFFALRAQRLLRECGLTTEHLAQVVVKNRRHGVSNPNAMFRSEVTVEQVLASRLVCDPLHLWMLCSPNEGAAAVVLRAAGSRSGSGSGSASGSGSRPVTVAAVALRSHLPGSVLGEDSPMCGIDDTTITPPTTLAANDAFEQAGVGPEDIDVVERQDTDAGLELLVWAELGLGQPGEQAGLLADGSTTLGGRLPVNPSGGLLSKGEPLGASALGQIVELVHQLRGSAGERQVEGAQVALAHVIGRGANARYDPQALSIEGGASLPWWTSPIRPIGERLATGAPKTRSASMRVTDLIRRKGGAGVSTDPPDASLTEAADELTTNRIGALVVTIDGRSIAGILSERDIVRHLAERGGDGLADQVSAAMMSAVRTCSPTDTVEELMEVMTEHRIRHLPVLVDGELAGIVSIGDVVKHRVEALEEERRHLTDYIQTGR